MRQADLFGVEAYKAVYRTTRAIRRHPVSKKSLVLWHTPLISHSRGQGKHMQIFDFEHRLMYSLFQNSQGYTENLYLKIRGKRGITAYRRNRMTFGNLS
ncbi:hypothetical protein KRX52_18440 [Pseudomonas sp. MAP12]|uniref:Uncharacterized protein n=1 Tax=Geopseudomonas aromaticivorans TaxID=2849492 RepID=A0ABS6N128_9GAMM|nr:hypothetical protein [Pseudomonas aromaticivorans]MBV2134754.1 hypothetical protein [Pseudomonas aromaticivorans]